MFDTPPDVSALLDSEDRPIWDDIQHDVLCARCEYNLRGIREPRCPECGILFGWAQVLDPSARRVPWLFEHQWADRPAGSFVATAMRALAPWTLWKQLRFTDRTVVGALLAYLVIWTVLLFLFDEPWLWTNGFAAQFGPPGGGDSFLTTMLGLSQWIGFQWLVGYRLGLLLMAWTFAALTLAMLWAFQQSLGRCRARFAQLLRVVVYALTCLWMTPLASTAWSFVSPLVGARSLAAAMVMDVAWLLVHLSGWLLFCVSLALGLHVYLKVSLGWLMVLLSQVVVILVMLNLALARF